LSTAPGDLTAPTPAGPAWTAERVVSIRRWTPTLLTFRITRPYAFRFTPGLYARLGLRAAGEPVWRAFSMVSAPGEPALEFFATLVPGGAFSSQLDRIDTGDEALVEKSTYGFLTLGQLAPGRDLWLVASGTGLGPFVSILRDAQAWREFDDIVVVHSVRQANELAYRDELLAMAGAAPGAHPAGDSQPGAPSPPRQPRLHYLPVVTREPLDGALAARVPALLEDGRLERAAAITLDVARSRVMVCGNPDMAADMRRLLTARGFRTSRRGVPGQMAFEKYW
jgi:ferredoxin/flavodoxin---NADP+ reductase